MEVEGNEAEVIEEIEEIGEIEVEEDVVVVAEVEEGMNKEKLLKMMYL